MTNRFIRGMYRMDLFLSVEQMLHAADGPRPEMMGTQVLLLGLYCDVLSSLEGIARCECSPQYGVPRRHRSLEEGVHQRICRAEEKTTSLSEENANDQTVADTRRHIHAFSEGASSRGDRRSDKMGASSRRIENCRRSRCSPRSKWACRSVPSRE